MNPFDIDALLRLSPTASAWGGVGGPTNAPDWDAWEAHGNLTPPSGVISPSQMPTYDAPDQPGITPEQSAAARAALLKAIEAPYTTGATSHGQPVATPTPAPVAAPAAPTAAPQADQTGWSGPLPTPPIPPPDAAAAPMATPAPSSGDGISSNARHNALNLRFAGQTGATNDNGFASFQTDEAGLNAARAQMTLDASKYGVKTLRGLVTTWLGGTDPDPAKARIQAMQDKGNNPDAYVASVSKATGIDPDAPLDVTDPAVQNKIIPAMSVVENGRGGGGGATPGPMIAATQTQTQPTQGQQGQQQQVGYQPFDLTKFLKEIGPELPYSPQQLAMPRGNALLALAGGLLSGHSFAQGLGQGLTNMSQMQMADIANKRAINGQIMQLAQLGMLGNYRGAMVNVAQQNANSHSLTASTGVQRMLNTTTPEGKAALANAKQQGKDNADANDAISQAAEDANVKIPQIEALQSTINSGQVATGPGLAAIKRQLSNYFGVDLGSDPTQTQISAAQAAQIRGTDAFAKNMRNVREFNSLMEGLSNIDLQNPQALLKLTNGLRNIQNLKLQMFNDWKGLGPEGRTKLLNDPSGAMSIWQADEAARWRQGLGKGGFYGDGSSALTPTASSPAAQASAAPVGGTTSTGVKWSLQ